MLKLLFTAALIMLLPFVAEAKDQITIVGSSTVFPFSTVAAEKFGKLGNATPVIESTGTGGGMKLFCAGIGTEYPDITNASRAIKQSERDLCAENGVTPVEYHIGYDGIVLGRAKVDDVFVVTREELYSAIANKVYSEGAFIFNPYTKWSEINPELPDQEIFVYGPPPTSGTRDAFVELVLDYTCRKIYNLDKNTSKSHCHGVREDGRYIESGENDNLIIQKLTANPDSFGIFGFSFLDQNSDKIEGSYIDSVEPSFDNIADGKYPVSRSLYFYVKQEHVPFVKGLDEFVKFFMSDQMIGEDGFAVEKGLIPLK